MTVYAIKQIPSVIARDDGKAIKFKILTDSGKEFEFECPPEAVPEIVARFLGAAQQLATAHQRPRLGIKVKKSEISVDEKRKTVGLQLYPTERTGIPFVLDPQHAQKISSDLAHASAIVDPKKPSKTN